MLHIINRYNYTYFLFRHNLSLHAADCLLQRSCLFLQYRLYPFICRLSAIQKLNNESHTFRRRPPALPAPCPFLRSNRSLRRMRMICFGFFTPFGRKQISAGIMSGDIIPCLPEKGKTNWMEFLPLLRKNRKVWYTCPCESRLRSGKTEWITVPPPRRRNER